MGFAFFVLVALGAGLYYATGGAVLNGARAKFVRQMDPAGGMVHFSVSPARPSWTFLLFRGGVSAVLLLAMNIGPFGSGGSLRSLGLPIWAICTYILFRPFFRTLRQRKAVRLTVTPESLTDGTRQIAMRDIVQFNVRSGVDMQAEPVAQTATVHMAGGVPVVSGGTSLSASVSRALHNRMAERSYVVTVRTAAGSEEQVLSGGLTRECAEALMQDLGGLLRQAAAS